MSETAVEYTLPGVLHYLQAEWRKFERERNEWVIERAELKARIALLEGERRGIENIKMTLTKRVKMLEYAIRQERRRHDNNNDKTTTHNSVVPTITANINNTPMPEVKNDTNIVDSKIKEKSREVLKSCLQEINYLTSFPSKLPLTNALTSKSTSAYRKAPVQPSPAPQVDSPRINQRNTSTVKKTTNNNVSSPVLKRPAIPQEDLEVPANVDEVAMINNIKEEKENFNASHDNNESLSAKLQEKFNLSEDKIRKLMKQQPENPLAGDFDPNQIGDIDLQQQSQPKLWKPRITIKGHLDAVRSVCFHPNEMIAASGSDDSTVKIWDIQRVTGKDGNSFKKGSLEEVDPIITYRGHTSVVTSVAISASQNRVYSGSLDSTIRVWSLPPDKHDQFAPVDPSRNIATYVGHTDAIWDFKLSPSNHSTTLLASISADKTIKIWDTESSGNLLKSSFTFEGVSSVEARKSMPAPTSLDFFKTDANKLAVSFANAKIRIYDIETGQVITTLKGSDDSYDNTFATQITSIVCHPTMPILVSGHEDRHIKFFDLNSGECIQTVSGHLDAVTSLDINSTGSTLVSGGHDSSIRLWDISSKTCIQEFSAHRKKGDEGVLDVKFHPSFPWMISGGADSIVKIYHYGH